MPSPGPSHRRGYRLTDFLVTGTDTGVGKTVVASALILCLRESGEAALGFKPAETGLSPSEDADSSVLRAASGLEEPSANPLLRLEEPLAPAVAADRAGRSLDPQEVLGRIARLRSAGYRLVVEGAGGVLVPLAWGFTVADLASQAGLSAVVVGRAGLGTLNHVLLTVEALERRGVPLAGIVLNGGDGRDSAEETNPAVLRRLLPGVVVIETPLQRGVGALQAARLLRGRVSPLLGRS